MKMIPTIFRTSLLLISVKSQLKSWMIFIPHPPTIPTKTAAIHRQNRMPRVVPIKFPTDFDMIVPYGRMREKVPAKYSRDTTMALPIIAPSI
jgi:hypothetical protein